MGKINSYKDLIVWQKSVDLVTLIYKITKDFPKEEVYGITSQIKRSAVSIPSNIAEGTGRSSRKDYRQFLHISYGSLLELETQLIIANRLGFLSESNHNELETLLIEISKMLKTIINKLSSRT